MKKSLLILIAVFGLSLSIDAQTFLKIMDPHNGYQVVNDTYITIQGTPGGSGSVGELEQGLEVKNISGAAMDVQLTRTEMNVEIGTKNTTCWYLCPLYINAGDEVVWTSSFIENIPDGDTNNTFVAHFRPNGVDGCSLFKYEFINTANTSEREVVYIKFLHNSGGVDCSTLDVAEVNPNLNKVNVYPNPAANTVKVSIENNHNISSLVIVDMLGKKVKTINVSNQNGVSTIDVASLNEGFYFVNSMNGQKIIESKKLIINR